MFYSRDNSVPANTFRTFQNTFMKTKPLLISFLVFAGINANSQCERNMLVLSPSFYKYGKGNLGVGVELGFLPAASKSFLTLKGTLFSKTVSHEATNYKGKTETYKDVRNYAFVGLKLNYVPQAFESLPRKWAFGAAAGLYSETKKENKPAVEFSSSYIIRMPSSSYDGGVGYLKLEGLCMVTPNAIVPGISVGVLLLL